MSNKVAEERTGWRDQRLSARHRRWGWDCPGFDIDWLFVEYDNCKATALVEYKHEYAKPQTPTTATYKALIDLGDRAGIPVFAVRYADNFSWWRVVSLNDYARKFVPKKIEITEIEWVRLLYKVRGRELPEDFFIDAELEI